jgi:hypothetical protein
MSKLILCLLFAILFALVGHNVNIILICVIFKLLRPFSLKVTEASITKIAPDSIIEMAE